LNREQRFFDACLATQHLLFRAEHVQPASDAALESLVGELVVRPRVVARSRIEVEHAAARNDREIRLPRSDRNLPPHVLLVLLGDDDLVARLVALRPCNRRQDWDAERR